MNNSLRSYLKKHIEEISGLPVYFFRANDEASYPYIVFYFKEYPSTDFVKRNYRMTIEIYASGPLKNALDISDAINSEFRHFYDRVEDFSIVINTETPMDLMDDSDKVVNRIIGSYDIRIVSGKEKE